MSLVCIFLLSIFILCFAIKRRNFSNHPPSPPKLPFIGNIHQISSLYHQSLYSLSQKYGPLMLIHFGEVPWLIVSSSEMACAVMRTHDLTFATRPAAVISDIIRFRDLAFEPYGEDWRQMKKIFTIHLMNTKKVASYKTIQEEEVGNLIAKISNHASISSGNPVELSKILFSFMIDVICRVVSGKFITEERRYAMIREVIEENFKIIGRFSIGDLFPSLSWLEGVIGYSRKARGTRNKWDRLLEEVIQAHIESGEDNEGQNSFVDILLSLKNDLSFNFELSMDHMKGLLGMIIDAALEQAVNGEQV
ncbi:cytochrome P450 71A1-like protein [Carex littledalei]|uniref:Cytochrome P450 71A1-like protein n=1 Tax=Carex littledalei TaxID=544730 RepID=A0A833RGJ5_9POAL|nr:cytochrome P450 71A1-like protein [Carex littledalei]